MWDGSHSRAVDSLKQWFKETLAVYDSRNDDLFYFNTVDQSVTVDEKLTDILILELGCSMPGNAVDLRFPILQG